VLALFVGQLGVAVAALICSAFAFDIHLRSDAGMGVDMIGLDEEATAIERSERAILIVQYVVLVPLAFAGLTWVYRAHANARALGADLSDSPAWAASWYIVPLANLIVPYRPMKEIWQASADPVNWRSQKRSILLPWWWFAWVGATVLADVNRFLVFRSDADEWLLWARFAYTASFAFDFPLFILSFMGVRHIYTNQMRWHASRTAVPAPKPAVTIF
jgi:hypothetical protein